MSDEQKTTFMRNAMKEMNLGDSFDYAESRRVYERLKELGACKRPCITLELVDPVMAVELLSWMYRKFDENGNHAPEGETIPLFGYNMVTHWFDEGSLMKFSDEEQAVLKEAVNILNKKIQHNER